MKTKNLKFIFFLTSLMLSSVFSTFSQEKVKAFEISTSDFDQFKIRYKFGNENYLFRINTIFLYGNKYEYSNDDSNKKNFGTGIGFGIEFPKRIIDQLTFHYGAEVDGVFHSQKYNNDSQHYNLIASGILGFAYHFNNIFRLGAEVSPGVQYNHSKSDDNTVNNFEFSMQNTGAEIVLGFYF